jgi:hypothetical protein
MLPFKLEQVIFSFGITALSMEKLHYFLQQACTFGMTSVYLSCFRKSVEKTEVLLKSDKNNRYFTRRRVDIFDNISLKFSWNVKCFNQFCRENKNTRFMSNNVFFRKLYHL